MRKDEPLVNKLLPHFLMGVALGLSLVLLLGLIEAFHVRELDCATAKLQCKRR